MGQKKKRIKPEKTGIQEIIEESRREFLKKASISGAALLSGGAAVFAGYRHEKSKNKENYVRVLTTDNKLVKVPADQVEGYKPGLKVLQDRVREGIKGKKWVMIIDLSKCRNARKCIEACQTAHHLRPMNII